jgi:hypothetical protein
VEVEGEGEASVSDKVRARGVSSRIDKDSGRVEGVIECHVEGDGLAMVGRCWYGIGARIELDSLLF